MPTQYTVVELAVEVDVECIARRVVDAGHVVPGVRLQRRRPVPEHLASGAAGELEADRARPAIDRRIQLEADLATGALGDDGRVVAREGCGVDPGADGHAAGQLERRGVPEIDEIVAAVELQRRCRTSPRPR